VYVVDDDPAVLRGAAEIVESLGLAVETFPSADAFLRAYRPGGPACLVVDVRMPGMSGLELQKELAQLGAPLPVIVITGYADVRTAVDAMKQGAWEFLEKPFRAQELRDSVQRAMRQDQEAWARRAQRDDAHRRIASLTDAEREVLHAVVAGKTNKMIAVELGLSLRAVEDRRARMMKKLQAASRAEVVALAAALEG
jgi:FixJ family two-component response regulator